MELTQKEKDFLNDFSKEEQLCIDKYERYEEEANDEGLKSLFATLRQNEMAHKQTIDRIMAGENVHFPRRPPPSVSRFRAFLPPAKPTSVRAMPFSAKMPFRPRSTLPRLTIPAFSNLRSHHCVTCSVISKRKSKITANNSISIWHSIKCINK